LAAVSSKAATSDVGRCSIAFFSAGELACNWSAMAWAISPGLPPQDRSHKFAPRDARHCGHRLTALPARLLTLDAAFHRCATRSCAISPECAPCPFCTA
jgi:hypothetical protein